MIKLSLLDTVEVKGNDMSNEIKIFCPQGLYIYLLYYFFNFFIEEHAIQKGFLCWLKTQETKQIKRLESTLANSILS